MKKLNILILLIFISGFVFSQSWNDDLYSPDDEKSGKNFYEIQKDFNEYWRPYNLQGGYYFENGKKHKAAGWKQFKRWEWYWETRINRETGNFPEINILKIQKEFLAQKSTKSDESNWQSMGPNSSDGGYAGIGRINCITFHPNDNSTFWIGAPSGGLWKTTDGGSSWEVLTDTLPVIGVSEVVLSNDYETSKTIYIATGDRDGGDNYSVGILKSIDDGLNWVTTAFSFNVSQTARITRLLMHPTNSDLMYACNNGGGIYKTDDGWASYSLVENGYFYDMEFKANCEDTVIYAAKRVSGGNEIIKTSDAGNNWEVIYTFSSSVGRIELDAAKSDSTIIYALASKSSDGGFEGIYKSINSGIEFTKIFDAATSGTNLLGWESDGSDNGGQGWYDLTLSVSPVDENHVYVGGVNTWETTDGGSNWNINNHWWGDGVPAVHADKHYMEYQDDNTFFELNDGGIYKTTNGGTSWTDLTDGMVISQIYKLGVSQTDIDEVITGLQDNGSKLISSSTWYDVKGGDGMECLIDYEDVNIQYATYVYGQIDRTIDHWADWQTVVDISANIPGGPDGAWVTPYLIDPDDNQTLYVGYEDIWKTTNRGDDWTQNSDLSISNKIRSMAIAPSDNQTLYITDFDNFYKTTNGGTSWTNLTSSLPSTSNSITYISVDANDPLLLWITYGGYDNVKAYESSDGGDNWINISAGLPEVPANTIIQNKLASSQQLYAGTDIGVFFKDGDSDWALFSNNLPSVIVTELEIYYDETTTSNSTLYASTYGRGLWKSNLATFESAAIELNSIDGPYYVSDDSSAVINISFDINETFSSNTFTAYLSDETGDFTSEIAIGDLVSDIAGTIEGVIPAGTISGTGYQVKVKSLSPVNESAASNSFEIVLDNVSPTVSITSSESGTTSANPFDINITFSEKVYGFEEADITISNATISDFDDSAAPQYVVEIAPTASGTVTVDVPESSATDSIGNKNTAATQWTITYTPTGIEMLKEYGINIFPNPSTGKFTIEVENNYSVSDVSIIDLSGRIIYNEFFSNNNLKEIDLSGFAKGMYILQLNIDNEKLTTKILIE